VLGDTGEAVTADLVRELIAATDLPGDRAADARRLFEQVALADDFVDFLTLPAYELID
jgi:malate synthase